MIMARVRMGSSWSDACILNLSTRGMLVRAPKSPARGAYLEIRRGAYVIVARVIWSMPDRFGVQTQDPVPADGLIRDPEGSPPSAEPEEAGFRERRARSRPHEVRHEASRRKGRAMEFGVLIAFAALTAILIGDSIAGAFAVPLGLADAALAAD
jgi:hypothetical protein